MRVTLLFTHASVHTHFVPYDDLTNLSSNKIFKHNPRKRIWTKSLLSSLFLTLYLIADVYLLPLMCLKINGPPLTTQTRPYTHTHVHKKHTFTLLTACRNKWKYNDNYSFLLTFYCLTTQILRSFLSPFMKWKETLVVVRLRDGCVCLYLLRRWSRLQVRTLSCALRGLLRGAEVCRGSLLPRLLRLTVTPHSLLAIWRPLLKGPITQWLDHS